MWLLTLTLWQNDIFLILMWINFTIYRIMQLIFRNRSYWKCPLCRIMTGASYMFCLGRLNNVLHSRFGFGFALTFHIHISFSQCLTLRLPVIVCIITTHRRSLQWWVCLSFHTNKCLFFIRVQWYLTLATLSLYKCKWCSCEVSWYFHL